jgi:hypothetical protein
MRQSVLGTEVATDKICVNVAQQVESANLETCGMAPVRGVVAGSQNGQGHI